MRKMQVGACISFPLPLSLSLSGGAACDESPFSWAREGYALCWQRQGWAKMNESLFIVTYCFLFLGSIDEVSQEVQMTWVQPRVLDREQVRGKLCHFV